LERRSLYSNQIEGSCEIPGVKGKSSPIQISGDKARRTSQGGAGRKYAELESELQEKQNQVEKLKKDLKIRRESEEQMKQVLKEYEKTISDLIAEKEGDKDKMEVKDKVIFQTKYFHSPKG